MTEFRDIPGFEGLYQVSRNGQVRALERQSHFKDGTLHRVFPEKVVSPYLIHSGYLCVKLRPESKGKQISCFVHRLVALTFIPNPENLPEVNHKDSNRANPNDWNLEWVGPKENMAHAMKFGAMKNKSGFFRSS